MVVFPEPVGPVIRMIPWGREMMSSIFESSAGASPMASSVMLALAESRIRMTTFSP
ncbi:MAG: hypothetical protein HZB86_11180 [Deltaproteobacteria bacterium]|nr:hypothetical protein [Deltaproteobacteria bacterium]